MKKKTIVFLIILGILSLLVFGCGKKQTGLPSTAPFIGGVGGLFMEFQEGLPPDYVFDNKQFPFGVVLKIENQGEADVYPQDGYVELVGINPNDFGVSMDALKKPLPVKFTGTKKNFDGTILVGTTDVVEFPNLNYQLDIRGNTKVDIRADLCYNYKTYTSSIICVKENLLEGLVEENPICLVSGPVETFSSKSPIHITNFRQDPLGNDKLQLTFEIDHVGGTENSFFKYTEPKCDDVVTNPKRNIVYMEITSNLNGKKPSCSGLLEPNADGSAGFIQLFETAGKQVAPRKITCTLDMSSVKGTFRHQIDIVFTYKYLSHAYKKLEIRDVSTGGSSS